MSILANRKNDVKRIDKLLSKRHLVLLNGRVGIGKTFLAKNYFLSKNYDVKFINGSRLITPDKIPRTPVGFDGRKIAFVIDEFDRGLSESYDNIRKYLFVNVLDEVGNIIDVRTRVPTIATCNETKKIQITDFYMETVNLKPLPVQEIQIIIANTMKKELDDPAVYSKAEKCRGDLRSAINNVNVENFEVKEEISQSSFVRNLLRKEPDQAYEYMVRYKVGEYKGIMGVEWLISVISRNLDDDIRSKIAILSEASRNKYTINLKMVLHAISTVCPIYIKNVNFPGGKNNGRFRERSFKNSKSDRS